ncbi:hypothetical protein pb186bvf_008472 [Paramecium bursaria]
MGCSSIKPKQKITLQSYETRSTRTTLLYSPSIIKTKCDRCQKCWKKFDKQKHFCNNVPRLTNIGKTSSILLRRCQSVVPI